jgi:hypothetical protein
MSDMLKPMFGYNEVNYARQSEIQVCLKESEEWARELDIRIKKLLSMTKYKKSRRVK